MTDTEEKVETGDVIMEDKKEIDESIGERSNEVTTSNQKEDSVGKEDLGRKSKRRKAKEVESREVEKINEECDEKTDDVMKDITDSAEPSDSEKPTRGVTRDQNTDSSEKKDTAGKSKRRKVEVIENTATDVVTKNDYDDTKSAEETAGKCDLNDKTTKQSVSDNVETNSDVTKDAEKKSDVKEVKKTKFTIKAKPKKSDASKDKTDATTEKVKSSEKSYDLKKTQNNDSDKKVATESEPLPPGVEKDDLAEPADDVTEKDDVIKAGGRLEQADLEDALELGEDEGEEGEDTELSHQEAINIYQKNLAKIIEDDPLLCDLATTCSLEEVRGRVALEHGQAMAVNVVKDTAEIMGVFVVQEGTVLDLKQAIKQHVMLHLERNAIHKPISWRYIWKTYWLYFEGQKLDDDRKKLKDYGIRNKSEVLFLKKLRPK